MVDQHRISDGLARDDCYVTHYGSRLLGEEGVTCPHCGGDSFTRLTEGGAR
jgi:hypothetical protein